MINTYAPRDNHDRESSRIEKNIHRERTVGRLVVVIDVNPSHGFWTARLMKVFGHEGKCTCKYNTLLMGEIDRPSTGRVEPIWGCLNNPSCLEWTTLTSLTAPLAALRSFKKTKERIDLS
jgi:hypothetical protein